MSPFYFYGESMSEFRENTSRLLYDKGLDKMARVPPLKLNHRWTAVEEVVDAYFSELDMMALFTRGICHPQNVYKHLVITPWWLDQVMYVYACIWVYIFFSLAQKKKKRKITLLRRTFWKLHCNSLFSLQSLPMQWNFILTCVLSIYLKIISIYGTSLWISLHEWNCNMTIWGLHLVALMNDVYKGDLIFLNTMS